MMQIATSCVDTQVTEKGQVDAIDKNDLHFSKPDLVYIFSNIYIYILEEFTKMITYHA